MRRPSTCVQSTPIPLTSVEAEPPLPSTQPAQPASTLSQEQPSADVLIEMKNVYKSFGSKAILRGANITIRRGEAVGIIGGSGTGKSTTLRIMAGLLMPDAVWLDHFSMSICNCLPLCVATSATAGCTCVLDLQTLVNFTLQVMRQLCRHL